ncbi:MAG TPA: hypothetical protein VLE19_02715 [Pyrinomonadaceae bacterium]|nr:hypothetical protein [Pyrinomonadaceae bacterium]
MLFRVVLFALLLFIPVGVSQQSFAATTPRPSLVIELIPHPGGTGMVTIKGQVNGHEGLFLFDTGGGVSYLTPDFARTVGCKQWGQITGFQLSGDRLDMPRCDNLSFALKDQKFTIPIGGVFDIMKYMPPNVPRLDGSIGLDLFDGRAVTLKWSEKLLIVESPRSFTARIGRTQEIPIRLVRSVEGVALTVDVAVVTTEGMAWMELDSGNGNTFVIGKHLAPILKLKTGTKEPQPLTLNIGGKIPLTSVARVHDTMIMDGNIGTIFLRNWDVTLDLAKGRAWVAQAGSS